MYLYMVGINFFVKIFVKNEPNGKKVCTYMVWGEELLN